MNQEPKKPQRGTTNVLRIAAGCYLLYTAYQLFHLLQTGQSDSPALCILGGGFFAVCGAVLLYLEWKVYRYAKTHKDDPDSWTEEPRQLEESDDGESGEGDRP